MAKSQFALSSRSLALLEGAQLPLQQVVKLAITLTTVDFAVGEVLRTRERQMQLVNAGASTTLNSRHLTGHAVDLHALVGGKVAWDWPLYHQIAAAMRLAAQRLGVTITWGGVWDRDLNDLVGPLDVQVADYATRWRHANPGKKRGPLVDGPHFQQSWDVYPLKAAA